MGEAFEFQKNDLVQYEGRSGSLYKGTVIDTWKDEHGHGWARVQLEGSSASGPVRQGYLKPQGVYPRHLPPRVRAWIEMASHQRCCIDTGQIGAICSESEMYQGREWSIEDDRAHEDVYEHCIHMAMMCGWPGTETELRDTVFRMASDPR